MTIAGGAGAATTPTGATLLASTPSPTVTELLGLMLPPSDNFFAETLTKDLGALYGGAGTTSAGAGVIRRNVAKLLGFSPRVVDGSGLSRADKTSPYQVVQLLAGLYPTPTGALLREHLAVAGRTGTLARRMRHTRAEGRCQGKTGTLEGASNLAGYCRAANGHVLAFAIFTDAISTEQRPHLPGPHRHQPGQLEAERDRTGSGRAPLRCESATDGTEVAGLEERPVRPTSSVAPACGPDRRPGR